MIDPMISKTVRFPVALVDFIDSQPGENFSQRLVGFLEDCQSGEASRQKRLSDYQCDIRRYSDLYSRLVSDYREAHRIMVNMQHYLSQLQAMTQNPLPDIRADTADTVVSAGCAELERGRLPT